MCPLATRCSWAAAGRRAGRAPGVVVVDLDADIACWEVILEILDKR